MSTPASTRQPIGYRIAVWRGLANMTQQELADAIGYQRPYVSMIENGKRLVNNRKLLFAIAEALSVTPADLTGQPYQPMTNGDLTNFVVVPQLRDALDEPDGAPVDPRPIADLDVLADLSMQARMNCDMEAIGRHLPPLLAEARTLWFDAGNREAGILFVKAAVTGCLAVKAVGFIDLAVRLAEAAETAANAVGDKVCMAAARFAVAQCALATGKRQRSARTAMAGIEELDRLTRTKLPPSVLNEVMALMGMLHLHTALTVAGVDGGDPEGHLNAADVLSRHVTGNPWRLEFGKPNVDTWRVGVALENHTPERAPELARRVDVNALLTPQRRSRLYLDLGRGLHQINDTEGAIRAFLAADAAAPGDLRTRPTAVETVGHMVRNSSRRGGSEALRDLAVRVGVDPFAPDPA